VIKYVAYDAFWQMTSWTDETLPTGSFTDESLPSTTWKDYYLPGVEVPLYAQDGTPLTDHNGNQLTAQPIAGTTWTDESLP
jgi:hypothetical protein